MGLSQQGLAQLLGVALQTVWRWEAGLTKPLPVISAKLEELGREEPAPSRRPPNRSAQGIPSKGSIPVARSTGRQGGLAPEFHLGRLFKGFGNLLELISQMAEQGVDQPQFTGEIGTPGGGLKRVYGFSVRMGLEGSPVIQPFGNIRETEEGASVIDYREPLVDVLEEEGGLRIVAELPGIDEQNIQIAPNGDLLELNAWAEDRTYHKEIPLPESIDQGSIESSYRNGVLEIMLASKE